MYGKSNMETYITICKIVNRNLLLAQETQTGALHQPRGVGWAGDGSEVKEGGHICIPMADSC